MTQLKEFVDKLKELDQKNKIDRSYENKGEYIMEKNMADSYSKGGVYDIEPQGSYKGSKLYSGRIDETGKLLVFCSNNFITVSDWNDEFNDDVKDMIKELRWRIDDVEKDLKEIWGT